jgi:hypothetical protein
MDRCPSSATQPYQLLFANFPCLHWSQSLASKCPRGPFLSFSICNSSSRTGMPPAAELGSGHEHTQNVSERHIVAGAGNGAVWRRTPYVNSLVPSLAAGRRARRTRIILRSCKSTRQARTGNWPGQPDDALRSAGPRAEPSPTAPGPWVDSGDEDPCEPSARAPVKYLVGKEGLERMRHRFRMLGAHDVAARCLSLNAGVLCPAEWCTRVSQHGLCGLMAKSRKSRI